MIRRITFISPDNGEELVFLTNLPNSAPLGVIAQLYFMRWRIEKSFEAQLRGKPLSTRYAKSTPIFETGSLDTDEPLSIDDKPCSGLKVTQKELAQIREIAK